MRCENNLMETTLKRICPYMRRISSRREADGGRSCAMY